MGLVVVIDMGVNVAADVVGDVVVDLVADTSWSANKANVGMQYDIDHHSIVVIWGYTLWFLRCIIIQVTGMRTIMIALM